MRQIIDELCDKGVCDDHIIYVNFEYIEYEDLQNYKTLNKYIKGKIIDKKMYYVFFDEIQNVDNFEINKSFALENVIYNDLIARGYDVYIGKTKNGEIDFIAKRYEEQIYVQVAYKLDGEKVIEREFGAYKNINDNFPKYVVSLDEDDFSRDGIKYVNMIDWLLTDKID